MRAVVSSFSSLRHGQPATPLFCAMPIATSTTTNMALARLADAPPGACTTAASSAPSERCRAAHLFVKRAPTAPAQLEDRRCDRMQPDRRRTLGDRARASGSRASARTPGAGDVPGRVGAPRSSPASPRSTRSSASWPSVLLRARHRQCPLRPRRPRELCAPRRSTGSCSPGRWRRCRGPARQLAPGHLVAATRGPADSPPREEFRREDRPTVASP